MQLGLMCVCVFVLVLRVSWSVSAHGWKKVN